MQAAPAVARHSITECIVEGMPETPDSSQTVRALVPHVYSDLRRFGKYLMRLEGAGHTLTATAVVNEAYLRLAGIDFAVHDPKHCFPLLAGTMRRVLIDHGRAQRREKRGQPSPEEMEMMMGMKNAHEGAHDWLDLEAAMRKLKEIDPEAAQITRLNGLFGAENAELQAIYDVSESTITRKLRFGRACLASFLKDGVEFKDDEVADEGEEMYVGPALSI